MAPPAGEHIAQQNNKNEVSLRVVFILELFYAN